MDKCWPLQMQPTAKSVLMALADEADEKGVCVPALSVLMTKTCFERTAVIEAVKWLESRQALLAERFAGKPTWFTIQPTEFVEVDAFSGPEDGAATQPSNVPVKKGRIPPGVTIHSTSAGFRRFWAAYPNGGRKTALAKCWALWQREKLEPLTDEIERHVLAMAQCQKWKTGYEPLTMTYLNGSCWNDPIPQTGPRNEARAYLEATLDGTSYAKTSSNDADALRRGIPAQVARLHAPRNG